MEAVTHASSRLLNPSASHGVSARASTPVGLGTRPLGAPLKNTASLSSEICYPLRKWVSESRKRACRVSRSALTSDELDVVPMTSNDPVDQQQGESLLLMGLESVGDQSPLASTPGGFSPEPPFSFDVSSAAASAASTSGLVANEAQVLVASVADISPLPSTSDEQFLDRAINATIVGAAGAFAITKILTVDHDYWHGWTMLEILKYAPLHNWSAYEEALKTNPILAKMMISGIVYAVGDWIAQCYEGRPILDISRKRMIRSGLVGFCLHGSLSHFYYHICEALFPFKEWWGVPIKVAFDQTIWSAFWNSVYFVTLGVLRMESPASIASELRATFRPMLTAGWKLWPFAHIITYGVVPVEQRLLWVDCVELVWVTILSMYSNEKANEKAEARAHEGVANASVVELLPVAQQDDNI